MSHVSHINREEGVRPRTGEENNSTRNHVKISLAGPNNTVYYNNTQLENPCITCNAPSIVVDNHNFYCARCAKVRQLKK